MLLTIAEVYQKAQELSQLEKIKVGGWVKSIRQNKFIELNDGSCLANLQLVCSPNSAGKAKQINFGSSLVVNGKLILTPERAQICELQVETINFFNPSSFEYHEPNNLPWINSGVFTNLYFLTKYTPPSKLVSEKAKIECHLLSAQPQTVLISDIDLNPSKIAWVSPMTKGTHVWTLLGTHVWTLLGIDIKKIINQSENIEEAREDAEKVLAQLFRNTSIELSDLDSNLWNNEKTPGDCLEKLTSKAEIIEFIQKIEQSIQPKKNAVLFFALRQIDFSRYASGSIIHRIQGSELMDLKVPWIINKSIQTRLLLLLNSPLAKIKDLHSQIKDLHSQIKDLLLLKYF